MKRFYKVNDVVFMEVGFIETTNKWYADLIDINLHKKIATYDNTDKVKLIADIVRYNWFGSYCENFALFIEDIFKY